MDIAKYCEVVFFVLDALDECTDDQLRDLLDILHGIIMHRNTNPNRGVVKFFISSRKVPDISRAFKTFPALEIMARKVDSDIKQYVTAEFDQRLGNNALRIRGSSLRQDSYRIERKSRRR